MKVQWKSLNEQMNEELQKQSEHEEWREQDQARRYREWKSEKERSF